MAVKGTVIDDNPGHYWLRIFGPNGYQAGPAIVAHSSSFTDDTLFDWDLNGLEDGEYTIKLEARDAADNKDPDVMGPSDDSGDSVDWITVTVDNSAPTVLLTAPSDSDTVSGTIDVLGDVLDNLGLSHYNLSLYPGSTDLSDGLTHTGDRINNLVGWDSYPSKVNVSGDIADVNRPLDTTLLADDEYQIRLAARDAAENRDTSSVDGDPSSVHVITITVDNTEEVLGAGTGGSGGGGEPESSNSNPIPSFRAFVGNVFNSTNPSQSNQENEEETGASGQVKSDATGNNNNGNQDKEKEVITESSSTFGWYWILLILALVVAGYYAYRNWRLSKNQS